MHSDTKTSYDMTLPFLTNLPEGVETRRWGYILSAPGTRSRELRNPQRLALLAGTVLLALAVTSLGRAFAGAFDPVMAGAALIEAALTLPLFYYASRGTRAYVYVNLYRQEIREVVPNHIGKPTVLRRLPFEAIGGVEFEEENDALVLRVQTEFGWRRVAQVDGCRITASRLRDTLARDIFFAETEATAAAA